MKLQVIVHTKSKRPRIETDSAGVLHVYVRQPPVEGRANDAVRAILAERYRVSKSQVKLRRGGKSKLKEFDIL